MIEFSVLLLTIYYYSIECFKFYLRETGEFVFRKTVKIIGEDFFKDNIFTTELPIYITENEDLQENTYKNENLTEPLSFDDKIKKLRELSKKNKTGQKLINHTVFITGLLGYYVLFWSRFGPINIHYLQKFFRDVNSSKQVEVRIMVPTINVFNKKITIDFEKMEINGNTLTNSDFALFL